MDTYVDDVDQTFQSNIHQEMANEHRPALLDSTVIAPGASETDCLKCKSKLDPAYVRCPICGTNKQQPKYESYTESEDCNVKGLDVSVLPSSPENGFQKRLLEIADEYRHRGLGCVLSHINEHGKTIPVNILVVGRSGMGKSSLINSILGLRSSDDGAAKVGLFTATTGTRPYSHTDYPNFVLWDSGGGFVTHDETYLNKIGLANFDCFIIVTAYRFTETDAWLVEASTKLKKKIYFVRTKIDNDILTETQYDHNTEKKIELVREYCCEYITSLKLGNPDVFLVSNFHPREYDLNKLIQKLKSFQTESLNEQLQQTITGKHQELQTKIATVVRWSSWMPNCICKNYDPLSSFMTKIQLYFGINNDSLRYLAELQKTPIDALKKEINLQPSDLFRENFFCQTDNTLRNRMLSKYLEDCFHECEKMLK